MNCANNNHATGLWNTLLDASWYRVDSRLVTIDGLGLLLIFKQVFAFSSLVGGLRYVLTRDRMTDFLFFSYFFCSSCCLPCHLIHVHSCGLHISASSHRPLKTSSHFAVHIHVSPILICCIVENPSEVVPSFPFFLPLRVRRAEDAGKRASRWSTLSAAWSTINVLTFAARVPSSAASRTP